MSSDIDEFKQYYALADQLYETMTSEQILETLRMLALHLATIGRASAWWRDAICWSSWEGRS